MRFIRKKFARFSLQIESLPSLFYYLLLPFFTGMSVISLKLKEARASMAIVTKNSIGNWKICKMDNISKIKSATTKKTKITMLTVPLILWGVANT